MKKQILFLIVLQLTHQLTSIKPTISSLQGDRLSQYSSIQWKVDLSQKDIDFKIQQEQTYQTMDGFGATFNEAGHQTLNQLNKQQQDTLLQFVFQDVGFSAMKVPIASTDFASNGPWFTYDDIENDFDLKHFSIQRDLEKDGVLTFVKKAQKFGNFLIESCIDYPPDWMLEGSTNTTIQKQFYGALAQYFLYFVQAYDFHGVTINIMGLFNEPMDSYTKIPVEDNIKLLAEYVGPLFRKFSPQTKLTINEMPDRNQSYHMITTIMENYPDVHEYLDIFMYHGYDCQFNCTQEELNFDLIAQMKKKYPNKQFWMTELCYAYEFGQYPPYPIAPQLPRSDFEDGFVWANVIYSDIEAGASAWIYWNLILNETGGPWQISPSHNDPDPNIQQPLIIIDGNTQEVTYTGVFWFLSHFSKFIRPGMERIEIQKLSKNPNLRALAFTDLKNNLVVNLMNKGVEAEDVTIGYNLNKAIIKVPAYSIVTLQWGQNNQQEEQ